MKINSLIGALLLLGVGAATQLPGQPNDAERKQFDAVKAKAEKGDAESQLNLYFRYANGNGVAKDPAKAVKWLRKAADQNLPRAQCLLGLSYANGEGVKPDKGEGVRWLRRAADQGLPEAQFDLGMCYANGDGVSKNSVEAAGWYRKAADQGLPDAQCELGNCYLEGDGVPKDVPAGVKWTRLAAEQGFAHAQNTLGLCYSKGRGVPKDCLEAYKWFDLAAAKGGELGDDARVNLAMAERSLTPDQVAEAQRLALDFKPRKDSLPSESPGSAGNAGSVPPGTGTGQTTNKAGAWASAGASRTGVVQVTAADEACDILVDGAFVGNTPAKVVLTEGSHVIEVKKPGFQEYRREIKVTEGSELTLRAVLEKQ